jgi:hypothetical protein
MPDAPISGLPAGTGVLSPSALLETSEGGASRNRTKLMINRPEPIETVNYAASVTIDMSTRVYSPFTFEITLTGGLTLNFSNGFDGQIIRARLVQDSSGGRVLTLGAAIGLSTDLSTVTLSSAANKVDYLIFEWRSANSKANLLALNMGFA